MVLMIKREDFLMSSSLPQLKHWI